MTMAPQREGQWFTTGRGRPAMSPHASPSTWSEGWAALTRDGVGTGATHHPVSICPPAPSTHQGRGPASPVMAAALRTPTPWTGGAQPDCPWPGSQLQAEATDGACLTRSPGSALKSRRSILPGQTLGSRWKEGWRGHTGKDGAPPGERASCGPFSLTKASPERSQRLDWYLPSATPTVHLVCCVGAGRGWGRGVCGVGAGRGWGGGSWWEASS